MYPQTVKSLSFLTVALLLLTATLPVRADSNKHSMGAMHPSSAGSVQKGSGVRSVGGGFHGDNHNEHHGENRGGRGWGLGIGLVTGALIGAELAAPYYPYYYPYVDPVTILPPTQYDPMPVQVAPSNPPSSNISVWYYCDSSKSYYPYIDACPEGWKVVPTTPPEMPSSQ